MDEAISLAEASRRWHVLLSRKRHSDELGRPAAAAATDSSSTDPFDCTDCAVLAIPELAVAPVARAVQAWRALDERKIAAADHEPQQQQNGGNSAPAKKPTWYNKHVRLPPSFDYSGALGEPPVDDGTGDRVLRLDHPTATNSYAAKLWHVFESVPKRSVLETQSLEGLSLPAMTKVRDQWHALEEASKLGDRMAVARIRSNDRHAPPEAPFRWSSTMGTGTLVFEVWRGRKPHLKRTCSPDSDRLILEFLGEQSLLDFHKVLMELRQDTYWDSTVRKGDKAQMHNEKSGLFVMENIFYTHGAVDYTKPILEWIREDTKRAQSCLGAHDADSLQVQAMKDVRLDQIALRLGVRYFHVHHGTTEAQIFLIDRRHGSPRQPTVSYPVIHDLWSRDYHMPICDGCRRRLAVYATSTECAVTDGHRVLCQACADQLQIPDNHIMAYHEWKATD
jgi:hypothetical protein